MMKLIRKIARKILFKKKTKIGGYDLDDKTNAKEDEPIIWMTPTTSVNSTPKDIKITPANPADKTVSPTTAAKKPGRPKGQVSKNHGGTKPAKKVAPKSNPNKK